jgi:putative PIN family toxin of toxin-antitoxin system
LKAVFDTNIIVSALVFRQGRVAWLREAWKVGDVIPVVSRSTLEELVRALAYPKFGLPPEDRRELLGDYLPYAEVIERELQETDFAACRDPEDRPFLALASAAGADALVSGDEHLLSLAGSFAFDILRPTDLRRLVMDRGENRT